MTTKKSSGAPRFTRLMKPTKQTAAAGTAARMAALEDDWTLGRAIFADCNTWESFTNIIIVPKHKNYILPTVTYYSLIKKSERHFTKLLQVLFYSIKYSRTIHVGSDLHECLWIAQES